MDEGSDESTVPRETSSDPVLLTWSIRAHILAPFLCPLPLPNRSDSASSFPSSGGSILGGNDPKGLCLQGIFREIIG